MKGQKSTNWIPNWPIIESESTSKIKLPGEFNFTFAGNLGKVQNLRNVLAGFKSVSNKFPNAWFNLIGDGSAMEELKLFVDSENILNVNFEGRKPLELMPDYFQASDVLIISLIDAPIYEIMIPSKFQTYLSYQKPIFAIMKGEVPAMVSQFNIGGSSDPDNIVDIQNGFEKFINSSEKELRYMGSESKKLLNNYFLRERNIKSLTKITFE
ncbi:glycosyltransferase [Algoriphagus halophilus]|uniref:glycosyltransferase n=1 Tax=Algoriphagus halophilus TaxID=226505 RepID=UPI00358E9712